VCKNVTKQMQHSDYHSSSKAGRHIDDLDLSALRINILGLC